MTMTREYHPLRDVKSVSQAFALDEDEAFMEQQLRRSCECFKMSQAEIDAYIRAWKSVSHATDNRIINPTMAQIEEISNRYKIAIPKNIPREGWHSRIFASVPKPASDWSRQVPDVEMPTSGSGRNSQQETRSHEQRYGSSSKISRASQRKRSSRARKSSVTCARRCPTRHKSFHHLISQINFVKSPMIRRRK